MSWFEVLVPVTVAAAIVLVPGIAVIAAGGRASPGTLLAAPALSLGIVAVSAIVAPLVGIGWSLFPVLALTVALSAAAALWHGLAGAGRAWRPTWVGWLAPLAGVAIGGALIARRLLYVLVTPDSVAQRFDNIVHLNAVRYALREGTASSLDIGATSDIGFYPGAWHGIVSLVAMTTGASLPVAVNATSIVLCALVWPAACVALARVLFPAPALLQAMAGILSSGFGAFPFLFLGWGPLYPNLAGYAVAPAVLAVLLRLISEVRSAAWRQEWPHIAASVAAAAFCAVAIFLSHPNALLVVVALATGAILLEFGRDVWAGRGPARAVGVVVLATWSVVAVALWWLARTPPGHSQWPPTQTAAQALGESLAASAGGAPTTWFIAVPLIGGTVLALRRPDVHRVLVPFAVATTLYILVSGTADGWLRYALTNPWYSDSRRIAAVIPLVAIPLVLVTLQAAVAWLQRLVPRPTPRGSAALAALACVVVVVGSQGPNVRSGADVARLSYEGAADPQLLSEQEQELLQRLDEVTAPDALIIASPRTGASLAYALGDREVTEYHIFGSPTALESFLAANLADIGTDPAVCEAVNEVGVDYVLDFGERDVQGREGVYDTYDGITNLIPSDHLVLVDSEGDDARLFRIEGC